MTKDKTRKHTSYSLATKLDISIDGNRFREVPRYCIFELVAKTYLSQE